MNLENLFKFSMGSESMKSFITVAETVSLNSKYVEDMVWIFYYFEDVINCKDRNVDHTEVFLR